MTEEVNLSGGLGEARETVGIRPTSFFGGLKARCLTLAVLAVSSPAFAEGAEAVTEVTGPIISDEAKVIGWAVMGLGMLIVCGAPLLFRLGEKIGRG